MPKSMTAEVANLIVQALDRGLSRSQIAGVVGVSRRAITRISTNLRMHGQPKAPPSGLKQGRPIKMSEAQANVRVLNRGP
jgi:transposase